MKQLVNDVRSGKLTVREMPAPIAGQGQVVVGVAASLISAGTERYVVDLSRKTLLGKALDRPDHVRRVLQKLRQEGLVQTFQQVRAKLDEPMPLGYSAAGVVLEVGRGCDSLKPGDRVAVVAPHASVVSVGQRMCASIPDGISFEQAAYTSVAAIALQGVRLAKVGFGDRVLVIGLGLIGQIATALLKASGCHVIGTDVDQARLLEASAMGADQVHVGAPLDAVLRFSAGQGVDAVLITAATPSNEPMEFAAEAARRKGRIVLVGAAGSNVPRPPFFAKELEFTVSSSLGPGRADPVYEERGIDYPFGHVRWTLQRNMVACLDAMAGGQLPVERLTTHRYPIERAAEAYEMITRNDDRYCGIVLEYPIPEPTLSRKLIHNVRGTGNRGVGVSVVGVGNFARLVMLPKLRGRSEIRWRGICSAKGMNAEHVAGKVGFAFSTTEFEQVLADEQTNVVFLLTRHDAHARMVCAALAAGKHVFVEKPLCIHVDELATIAATVEQLGAEGPILMVGHNRRFAPGVATLRGEFAGIAPLSLGFRFATAPVPADSWLHDENLGGGRLVGEAGHAIDTCAAIAGSPPVRVFAESVAGDGPRASRVHIVLRHRNGSISAISYQSDGSPSGPKERIEVFGGGRTAVIDDWADVELWRGDKHSRTSASKDKGHEAEIEAFLMAVSRGGTWPVAWDDVYGCAWATLMAAQSLRDGVPYHLDWQSAPQTPLE